MVDLLKWLEEYSPWIVLLLALLAANIFVLKKAVESTIESAFKRKEKEFELSLQRRSTFWEKVLMERYTLVATLMKRIETVTTNLRACLKKHECRGIMPGGGVGFVSSRYKPTLPRWLRWFRSPARGGGGA